MASNRDILLVLVLVAIGLGAGWPLLQNSDFSPWASGSILQKVICKIAAPAQPTIICTNANDTVTFVGLNGISITTNATTKTVFWNGTANTVNFTFNNVGAGSGVFKNKSGLNVNFRSIIGSGGVTTTQNTNDITLALANIPKTTIAPSGQFPWNNVSKTGSILNDIGVPTSTYDFGAQSLKNVNQVNTTKVFQGGVQDINTLTAGTAISISGSGNSRTISTTALTSALISLNGDNSAAQTIQGTTNHIKVTDSGATHTIDLAFKVNNVTCPSDWVNGFNNKTGVFTCAMGAGGTTVNSFNGIVNLVRQLGNTTISNSSNTVTIGLGVNPVIVGGSDQPITKSTFTINNLKFGGNANANNFKINNLNNATSKNDAVNARNLGLIGNLTLNKCTDQQLLKYQLSNQTWVCENDLGGSTGGLNLGPSQGAVFAGKSGSNLQFKGLNVTNGLSINNGTNVLSLGFTGIKSPDYIVYSSSGTYYAFNQKTGNIDYSGTDWGLVMNQTINQGLGSTGGTIRIGLGSFNDNTPISIPTSTSNTVKTINIIGSTLAGERDSGTAIKIGLTFPTQRYVFEALSPPSSSKFGELHIANMYIWNSNLLTANSHTGIVKFESDRSDFKQLFSADNIQYQYMWRGFDLIGFIWGFSINHINGQDGGNHCTSPTNTTGCFVGDADITLEGLGHITENGVGIPKAGIISNIYTTYGGRLNESLNIQNANEVQIDNYIVDGTAYAIAPFVFNYTALSSIRDIQAIDLNQNVGSPIINQASLLIDGSNSTSPNTEGNIFSDVKVPNYPVAIKFLNNASYNSIHILGNYGNVLATPLINDTFGFKNTIIIEGQNSPKNIGQGQVIASTSRIIDLRAGSEIINKIPGQMFFNAAFPSLVINRSGTAGLELKNTGASPGDLQIFSLGSDGKTYFESSQTGSSGIRNIFFTGPNSADITLTLVPTTSGVNYLQIQGAITKNNPILQSTGTDTNIGLLLEPKGTGNVQITNGTDLTKKENLIVSSSTGHTNNATFPNKNGTLAMLSDIGSSGVTTFTNIGHGGKGILASISGTLLSGKNITSANSATTITSNSTDVIITNNALTSALTSLNGDTTAAQKIVRDAAGNLTITNSTGQVKIGLGSNIVTTGLAGQTVTKTLTLNSLTLGGQMNLAGNTILNTGTITLPTTTTTLGGLALTQTWNGNNTMQFGSGGIIQRNPASTFGTTLINAAQYKNNTVTWPIINGTKDEIAVLNGTNTWLKQQNFTGTSTNAPINLGVGTSSDPTNVRSGNFWLRSDLVQLRWSYSGLTKIVAFQNIAQSFSGVQTFLAEPVISSVGDTSKTLKFLLSGQTTGKILTIRTNQTTTQGLNIPNISRTETLAVNPVTNFTQPANQTAISSQAIVMYGGYATITPKVTGNLDISVRAQASDSTLSAGCRVDIRFSTSNMGANGAAATGTVVGNNIKLNVPVTGDIIEYSDRAFATGLTVGTKYFIDLGVASITGGSCTLNNPSWAIREY